MRRAFSVFVVAFLWVFSAPVVEAATLYLDPGQVDIFPGDTISLAVRVDTDANECINAIDAVIEYDPAVIPVDVSRGFSIMPIWVEDPVIDAENHTISFAGGIPNGYCGRIIGDPRLTNVILEILFQAPAFSVSSNRDEEGLIDISFSPQTQVFLNDGFGTKAELQTFGAKMKVGKKPRSEPVDEWLSRVVDDDVPPNEFSITLDSNPSIYNGRYYITFNTTDKQSGIDHYEIIEEPIDDFDLFAWGGVSAPWKEVESPYLLKDQTLNRTIRVKAVDKAGNEYIAVYVPPEEMRGKTDRDLAGMGLLVAGIVIVLIAVFSAIWYRMRLARYEASLSDE